MTDCLFCAGDGGRVVARTQKLRIVHADEAGFPAFYRVIWNAHQPEFTDLPAADRALAMDAVAQVERALRQQLAPTKVNLASLGNMTPHLHWHVIARFAWDSHWPGPVWAAAQRPRDPVREAGVQQRLEAIEAELAREIGAARAAVMPK